MTIGYRLSIFLGLLAAGWTPFVDQRHPWHSCQRFPNPYQDFPFALCKALTPSLHRLVCSHFQFQGYLPCVIQNRWPLHPRYICIPCLHPKCNHKNHEGMSSACFLPSNCQISCISGLAGRNGQVCLIWDVTEDCFEVILLSTGSPLAPCPLGCREPKKGSSNLSRISAHSIYFMHFYAQMLLLWLIKLCLKLFR